MTFMINPYVGDLSPNYLWYEQNATYGTISTDRRTWTFTGGGATSGSVRTGIAAYGGRVYCEIQNVLHEQQTDLGIGVTWGTNQNQALSVFYNSAADTFYSAFAGCGFSAGGGFYQNGSQLSSNLAYTINAGDIIGIAIDTVALKMWVSKNGSWIQGDPGTATNAPITLPAGKSWYFYASNYACSGAYGPAISYFLYPARFTFTYPLPTGYVPYQPDDINNPTPDSRWKLSVPFTSGTAVDTSPNPATLTIGSDALISTAGLHVSIPANSSRTYDAFIEYSSTKFVKNSGDSLVIEFYLSWAYLSFFSTTRVLYINTNNGWHNIGFSGNSGALSWTAQGDSSPVTSGSYSLPANTTAKITIRITPTGNATIAVNDVVELSRTISTLTYSSCQFYFGLSVPYQYDYTVSNINIWTGTM